MNAKTKNPQGKPATGQDVSVRAGEAGAHNVRTGDEFVGSSWIRENKNSVLFVILLVLGVGLASDWLPGFLAGRKAEQWTRFDQARQKVVGGDLAEVRSALEDMTDEPELRAWLLASAARGALLDRDRELLEMLLPELEEPAAQAALDEYPVDEEPGNLLAFLASRTEQLLATPPDDERFANPEPPGRRVKLSISVAGEGSYEFILGLYEERAPETCARFLEAVDSGTLLSEDAQLSSVLGVTIHGLSGDAEDPAPIPLERSHGLFHRKGSVSTRQDPGADLAGAQNTDVVILHFEPKPNLDGRSNVFAQVVEGEDHLETLADLAASLKPELPTNPGDPAAGARSTEMPAVKVESVEILE